MTPIDVYLANNFNIIEISEFGKVWSLALVVNLIDHLYMVGIPTDPSSYSHDTTQ